jgi:uncharacterized OB-fold protein
VTVDEYFLGHAPLPEPTIDDRPFWQGCRQKRLCFQQCADCGLFRHPPRPGCPRCQSFASRWVEATDEAELFSFTVVNYAAHAALKPLLPYNVAIVLFPSFDNVRLVSNVIDCPPQKLRIGMKLRLEWQEAKDGMFLPRFRAKD